MAGTPVYVGFDPLLGEAGARGMIELCERFGAHGMYSEEGLNDGIGEGLPQRFDAAFNFIRTGGRLGQREDLAKAAARTNYFRETYAYGEQIFAPGIEPFLRHEGFIEASRRIHDRPLVEPAIVFANLLVPGQQLATHTDVPEFRGANRKVHPQWLLVVMHHSGLFDEYRMPIATGIAWFHDAEGGELAFYPEGPEAPPVVHPVRRDTALLLDTDSIFHGIDRVRARNSEDDGVDRLQPGMKLVPARPGAGGSGARWEVRAPGDAPVARYDWDELRFSVSWKAYCFRDEAEQRMWREHADDLRVEDVLDRLEADLRERGRLDGPRPASRELATLLVEEYIRFPEPSA